MTIKKLSQLYYLKREIEQDQQRLAQLETALTGVAAKIDGLPHIGVSSNKKEVATDLAEIMDLVETKKQMCIAEYNRLMCYITNVEDSFMRQLLTLRYVNGFSWVQVAMHMGGGNTDDSVRKAHKRFLEQN